ncbi:uracil-DNA glycosylase [Candidatus Woesearchaeota archaeon]|nr:uracil-DNA glycosylase [Candidatus Woesearchaeota archaeon]
MKKDERAEKLLELHKRIRRCSLCFLSRSRMVAVPGTGNMNAKIFFVGEAPGNEEDKIGRPFVGRSGKFLDWLFGKYGFDRKKVFITSIVKCRPPKNRKPKPEEISVCRSMYLQEQIRLIQPKVVVLFGEVALKAMLNLQGLSKIHGIPIKRDDIIYFPTYHPASGMRFPEIRKKMMADFRKLRDIKTKI